MISNKVNSIIQDSGISFGTSGARGLVSDFEPLTCAAFTQAFLEVMERAFKFEAVAIGIDNRPSSIDIAKYCAEVIMMTGRKVIFAGVLPTPALAYYSNSQRIPCIMVTGSHIPFDRNGLKFYTPEGEITKCDEIAILNTESLLVCDKLRGLSSLEESSVPREYYIERYVSLFSNYPLKGYNVGIYEHSSSGRDIYSSIFKRLGANVTSLERTDYFVPIDTEAVSDSDITKAQQWSINYRFDAIFTTDGDGDRPLVADENGNWLRGDILGLLCSKFLSIDALAVPVSCNSSIEKSNLFDKVIRTRIGSPYVIEGISLLSQSFSTVSGFEANGGYLLGSSISFGNVQLKKLATRDAVLPALSLMLMSVRDNREISKIVASLPQRFTYSDRLKDFPSALSAKLIKSIALDPLSFLRSAKIEIDSIESITELDGLRITFNSQEVVHLRPSGNAPELRCYSEASSHELSVMYVNLVLSYISNLK